MATETSMSDGYKASYCTGIFGVYPFAADDKIYPYDDKTYPYNEIMKLDRALARYFTNRGRSDYYFYNGMFVYGRFKAYVEENGADDADLWQEEMELLSANNVEDYDGLLAQFFDDYPEEEKERIASEEERLNLLLTGLQHEEKLSDYSNESRITLTMFDETTDRDVDETTEKYRQQMPSVIQNADKDKDLKWFLAASEKVKYPFLTFMVDSYTKARAKMNAEQRKALPLSKWILDNEFMKALKGYNSKLYERLENAIKGYSNRIMPRLQIGAPAFKMNDDLKEVTEYIVAVAGFIKNLMATKTAVVKPPFIVDLLIAVKSVSKEIQNDQQNEDDSDDDEDEYENKEKEFEDPSIDHIGHVQDKLKSVPCHHFPKDNYDRSAPTNETVDKLSRELQEKYNDFRSKMEEKDYGDDMKQPEIQFDDKTYPQFRRFSLFVDRRENKPTKGNKDKDQITFFQQPNECSIMETDHVYEVGFEFARKSLIPANDENITAKSGLCGQLLTFMFDVKAINEIKCYIIWNGQTMRFECEHIAQVLPYLFTEGEENKKFDTEKGEAQNLMEKYKECVEDREFERFCKEFEAFSNQ